MKKLISTSLAFLLIVNIIACFPQVLAWELERPGAHITIDERAENATTDGKASVGLGVHVAGYRENWPAWPYDDIVDLRIVATANSRKILEYGWSYGRYYWYDESWLPNQILLDDNQVGLVAMPFKARFYGGPGSAEYEYTIISSNGWLSFFDLESGVPPSYPYVPNPIPNTANPNNFIAPFWRDLKPITGGKMLIRYGPVSYWPGYGQTVDCFAISWIATDKYGYSQTFQVLIERAPSWWPPSKHPYLQSRIWFQYQTITKTDSTTIGVEDQGGWRGAFFDYQNLGNEMNLEFGDLYQYARIKDIAIKLSENENSAFTRAENHSESIRGTNVVLNQALPPNDPSRTYERALAGAETLLLSAWGLVEELPAVVPGIGFMISSILYLEGLAHDAAERQAAAILLKLNDTYAKAQGFEPNYNTYPVDASLDITAYWVFADANNQSHTLTITSELTYEELNYAGDPINTTTISTSVKLKMYPDDNNSFGTAKRVPTGKLISRVYLGGSDTDDYYKVWADQGQIIYAVMDTPSDAIFYFYLYSPSNWIYPKTRSEIPMPGVTQAVVVTADSTGDWIIRMKKLSGGGFYQFVVNVYWPPDGGGCPTLFVWNGSEFVDEGVLNIHSEPNVDVVVNHTMTIAPLSRCFVYTLKLAEIAYGYNISHSYIDQVKLYVTDYNNVTHESYLIYANHSRHGNVWNQLFFSDDTRIESLKNDEIILKFLAPLWVSDAKAFTFRIEGHNPLKV